MEVYRPDMPFMELKIVQEFSGSKIPHLVNSDEDALIKQIEESSLQPRLLTQQAIHTFTTLSNPPETTQRPSGVNLIVLMPRV